MKKNIFLFIIMAILVCVSILQTGVFAKQNLAAILYDIKGSAQIISGGKSSPALTMQMLNEGDEIKIPKGCEVTIRFKDRHKETVKGEALVKILSAKVEIIKGAKGAVAVLPVEAKVKFPPQTMAKVTTFNALTIRNKENINTDESKNEIKLNPLVVMMNLTPTFNWEKYENIDFYTFEIFDINNEKVIFKTELKENSIEYKSSCPALKWGKEYSWEVKAYKNKNCIAKATGSFKILSEQDAKQIIEERKNFDKLIAEETDTAPYYKIMISSYYEKELYNEALPLLKKLVEMAPDDKETHLTLSAVYAKLGKDNEAQKELKIAERIK